jgi:hypothetical protein
MVPLKAASGCCAGVARIRLVMEVDEARVELLSSCPAAAEYGRSTIGPLEIRALVRAWVAAGQRAAICAAPDAAYMCRGECHGFGSPVAGDPCFIVFILFRIDGEGNQRVIGCEGRCRCTEGRNTISAIHVTRPDTYLGGLIFLVDLLHSDLLISSETYSRG